MGFEAIKKAAVKRLFELVDLDVFKAYHSPVRFDDLKVAALLSMLTFVCTETLNPQNVPPTQTAADKTDTNHVYGSIPFKAPGFRQRFVFMSHSRLRSSAVGLR